MTETGEKIVLLNSVVGCHLLDFLHGIDAANFLETVNTSDQFHSIATTSDHTFRQLIKQTFRNVRRIVAPRVSYERYLDCCEIIDDKLAWLKDQDSPYTEPRQRLFIHSCFSVEGFGVLCKAYRTPLFQCYSRLLPFNTEFYCADFGLLDYELFNRTIILERDLNDYEQQLFKSKRLESSKETYPPDKADFWKGLTITILDIAMHYNVLQYLVFLTIRPQMRLHLVQLDTL